MAILRRTIPAFLVGLMACLSCSLATAQDSVRVFRIGLIHGDPGQLVQDFDPFVNYLRTGLRRSGFRDVTVFIAKDLDQMRGRIQKGRLDFILTSPFPVIALEREQPIPAVVAVRGTTRADSAVFFVRKQSPVTHLAELAGKTIVFGTPWSTAYSMARIELNNNTLLLAESSDKHAPPDAVRYSFAGEAINQTFRVIRRQSEAGVFSSSDWEELADQQRSRLRIILRTGPYTRLLGSFLPSFPPGLRDMVERTLIDMSGNKKGRTALSRALNISKFEPISDEDRKSVQRFKKQLSIAD